MKPPNNYQIIKKSLLFLSVFSMIVAVPSNFAFAQESPVSNSTSINEELFADLIVKEAVLEKDFARIGLEGTISKPIGSVWLSFVSHGQEVANTCVFFEGNQFYYEFFEKADLENEFGIEYYIYLYTSCDGSPGVGHDRVIQSTNVRIDHDVISPPPPPPPPPPPEYDLYKDEKYGFSIEYPRGWEVEKNLEQWDDEIMQVSFYPKGWGAYLGVSLMEYGDHFKKGMSGDEILDMMVGHEKEWCSGEFDHEYDDYDDHEKFICKDFRVDKKESLTVNGMQAYRVMTSWTHEYESHEGSFEKKTDVIVIPTTDQVWMIFLDGESHMMAEFERAKHSLLSFKLKETAPPPPPPPPPEFVLYDNDQYGFSIEYLRGWTIDERLEQWDDGMMLVEFSSKTENSFLEIMRMDGNGQYIKDGMTAEDVANMMVKHEKDWCMSFSDKGEFACTDFKISKRFSTTLGSFNAHRIMVSWMKEFPQLNDTFEKKSDVLIIDTYGKFWMIKLDGEGHKMDEFERAKHSLLSFKLKETTPPPPPPPPEYDLYKDEKYGFSIEYPRGWEVEREHQIWDDAMKLIGFHSDDWSAFLEVALITDDKYFQHELTDDEIFQEIINHKKEWCSNPEKINEYEYYKCSDFKVEKKDIVFVDGKKSFRVVFSWLEEFVCMMCDSNSDFMQPQKRVSDVLVIPENDKIWIIMAHGDVLYPIEFNKTEYSILSFKLKETVQPPPPPPDYTLYKDEKYGFSIEYPRGWEVEKNLEQWDDEIMQVSFYPKGWGAYLGVSLMEYGDHFKKGMSGDEILDMMVGHEKEWCSGEFDHEYDDYDDHEKFICKDFRVDKKESLTVNGMQAYRVMTSWTHEYESHEGSFEKKTDVIVIPTTDQVWMIFLDGESHMMAEFERAKHSLLSFKLSGIELPVPVLTKDDETQDSESDNTDSKIDDVPYDESDSTNDEIIDELLDSIESGSAEIEFNKVLFSVGKASYDFLKISGTLDVLSGEVQFVFTAPDGEIIKNKVRITKTGHFELIYKIDDSFKTGIYDVTLFNTELGLIGKKSFEVMNSQDKSTEVTVNEMIEVSEMESYQDGVNGFKIDYPKDWLTQHDVNSRFGDVIIQFVPEFHDSALSVINVLVSEMHSEELSDEFILKSIVDDERAHCSSFTLTHDEMICRNFTIIKSQVNEEDGKKSYDVIFTWLKQTSVTSDKRFSMTSLKVLGDDVWVVTSDTSYKQKNLKRALLDSVLSFDVYVAPETHTVDIDLTTEDPSLVSVVNNSTQIMPNTITSATTETTTGVSNSTQVIINSPAVTPVPEMPYETVQKFKKLVDEWYEKARMLEDFANFMTEYGTLLDAQGKTDESVKALQKAQEMMMEAMTYRNLADFLSNEI